MILLAFEYYPRDLNNAATSQILVNPAVICIFINNCKFVFLFICCYYKFNFEFFFCITIQHYLIKKTSLFNVYTIRVGLNNAATSRILVNPPVILIL